MDITFKLVNSSDSTPTTGASPTIMIGSNIDSLASVQGTLVEKGGGFYTFSPSVSLSQGNHLLKASNSGSDDVYVNFSVSDSSYNSPIRPDYGPFKTTWLVNGDMPPI